MSRPASSGGSVGARRATRAAACTQTVAAHASGRRPWKVHRSSPCRGGRGWQSRRDGSGEVRQSWSSVRSGSDNALSSATRTRARFAVTHSCRIAQRPRLRSLPLPVPIMMSCLPAPVRSPVRRQQRGVRHRVTGATATSTSGSRRTNGLAGACSGQMGGRRFRANTDASSTRAYDCRTAGVIPRAGLRSTTVLA